MATVNDGLARQLEDWGALPSQVVDLERDDDPRILRYLDLCNVPAPGRRRPLVVEAAGQPRLHVFDGRQAPSEQRLKHLCLRTTLRGDGAWVAVLEPGRLRVFSAEFESGDVKPTEVDLGRGRLVVPRFLYDKKVAEKDWAVRDYLLGLLRGSITEATRCGVSPDDALSLVGRGLFWRFLVDRDLLGGMRPGDVCGGATSWPQCLDAKMRALRTFEWLNDTFNGGLLPFKREPSTFHKDVFHRVLGNIAHGATSTGQLRLPTDWSEVNFAYIPVGLMSEVYEAFAHERDPARARDESIHYTPRHIAEFLVAQALASVPAGARPRILDPAAGAGVFLVTAFRQLAEREWSETGERPRRTALRRILERQIAGLDINESALRLAELALYITALELDPDPRPLKDLRFGELRGRVLFPLRGGVAGGSLEAVAPAFRGQFDVVVGNPPWTAAAKGGAAKRRWRRHSLDVVRDRLGEERAKEFDFPDTNPDLPFLWRAMEWAKPAGSIALVTHARWLFGLSDRATRARQDLLQALHVTGILNGAALRLTEVWPNANAPFCLVFAANEKPPARAAFQFVSPLLDATPDKAQARMRIDWLDAPVVAVSDVLARPWTLKTRFRGNRLAERALDRLWRGGVSLGEYLTSLGTDLKNGYQVGGTAGKQVSAAALHGLADLKGLVATPFVIDDAVPLPVFSRKTLLFPRDPANYRRPLLLVREAIPAQRLAARALRSERDVAYHASFHGATFADVPDGAAIVRYLQLVLQSSASIFFELLCDARYGVERDTVYLESIRRMPMIPFASLDRRRQARCATLSQQLVAGMSQQLARDIDDFVFDLYGLLRVDREAVYDTLDTALPSTQAKANGVRSPTAKERAHFIATLAGSLEDVLAASGLCVFVRERDDLTAGPWRLLQIDVVPQAAQCPELEGLAKAAFLGVADEAGASLVMCRANDRTWFVGLLERYALWTSTRARLLATDLIVERSSNA